MAAASTPQLWRWTVPDDLLKCRADKAIIKAPDNTLSRSQLQRLMEEGRVRANGETLSASDMLLPGDEVEVEIPAPTALEALPEEGPLEILFEDKDLLIVNKPPSLSVHPSDTEASGTLVNRLLFHIKDLSGIGGKLRPGIVHRLDKNTSGALVVSKSDEAHRKLVEIFAAHRIERRYWALCYGCPATPSKTIQTLIGRNPNDRKKMAIVTRNGREAISHYQVLENYGFASLIEVKLETGRTHQVRVHLTAEGYSVLGDPVYGTPSSQHPKWLKLPEDVRHCVSQLPGQALHAKVLGFKHPITGQELRFEAAFPAVYAELLDKLRKHQQP